jgi:hypothetical protein
MTEFWGPRTGKLGSPYVGLVVIDAKLDSGLTLTLGGALPTVVISIEDRGQNCCEHRYVTTDDDVKALIGRRLTHIEPKPVPTDAPPQDDYSDVHEICFVEVQAEDQCVTLVTHNEHNGYYGGFDLCIVETEAR